MPYRPVWFSQYAPERCVARDLAFCSARSNQMEPTSIASYKPFFSLFFNDSLARADIRIRVHQLNGHLIRNLKLFDLFVLVICIIMTNGSAMLP